MRELVSRGAAVVLLFAATAAAAGSIDLAWEPAETAAGYRVYWAVDGQPLGRIQDVGNVTEATITGLDDCRTLRFAVAAYNSAGESPLSNEVTSWPKPELRVANPGAAMQGEQFNLELAGANFQPGAELTLEAPGVHLDGMAVVSCNEIEAVATVEPRADGVRAAQVGRYDLTIVNPDRLSVTRVGGFEVQVDPARFDVNDSDETTRDRIDGKDTVWLSRRFGSREGQPAYAADFDIDGDGWIDGFDLAYIASNLGGCWDGSTWRVSACRNRSGS